MQDEAVKGGFDASLALAVIPARGGSKRVPRKNIRSMSGRPLVSWAIELATGSLLFDKVVVSTDDAEIADIAKQYGADVPFRRSKELSNDFASTIDVVADAIKQVNGESRYEAVCCLYPTSIFATGNDLLNSRRLLDSHGHPPYVVSIARFSHPIQRALAMTDDSNIHFLQPDFETTRTQDLTPHWHDAGQFYWGKTTAWMRRLPILSNARGYEIPHGRVQDIDTEDDWIRAELLHDTLQHRGRKRPGSVGSNDGWANT